MKHIKVLSRSNQNKSILTHYYPEDCIISWRFNMSNKIEQLRKSLAIMQELTAPAPVSKKKAYRFPSLDLLKDYPADTSENQMNPRVIEEKIHEFNLNAVVTNVRKGPMITRYELKLLNGTKLSNVRSLSEDLAVALMAGSIRILAPIPGTSLVGIEVANEKLSTIGLKTILTPTETYNIPISIGVDVVGQPKIIDLTKLPHLLIAGTTGSGKSVFLNSVILSILYHMTPEECELILVDPKRVEMTSYKNIPHLRCPIVTETSDTVEVFSSLIEEMERRYTLLAEANVRNIESFNELRFNYTLPYIVTIVDEMSDLLTSNKDMTKQLEETIVRLAQKSRAAGIHLILATQRPVKEVVTGLIKANMPSRIAFQVSSQIDSRVILDRNGAEKLIGRGDMLMTYPGVSDPERFHGAWVSDSEISAVVNSLI
jgi:DNA segregation ATPase FtsK/SpoIIIE and related proteins